MGKEYSKAVCVVNVLNLYAEYIVGNARLDESQAGIKIAWRNINNLRHTDGTTPMAEREEELKRLLMSVKEESEKVGLKLSIKKLRSWYLVPSVEGEKVEAVTDIIFLGYKITVNSDCSHEIKRCLLLGRKATANLDSVLESRDSTVPTKVCIIKDIVFRN